MRPFKLSKALMCRSLPECVSPPPPMLIKKARDGHGCLLNSGSEGFLALNCMPFLFFRKARTCLPLTSQNMLFEEQLGFCALKCLLFFFRTRDGPFRIFCWLFFGPIHKLLKKNFLPPLDFQMRQISPSRVKLYITPTGRCCQPASLVVIFFFLFPCDW